MADKPASSLAPTLEDNFESSLPGITKESLQWDKTQWADGSVFDNDFYLAPEGSSDAAPGTLLKLEQNTNTSLFSLPPATALSRFIYQSKTLNGSLVPVSAYVLWPYSPRSSKDGYQVVAWCHGTSGFSANCAPSHHITLWQHYLAPYNLAQQGYVVVATDYAGLGVAKTATGKPIVHEYLASPSHANDAFYSVQAARAAFPELGKDFVVMGHSQGGGAAWGAAQRQAKEPAEGYLGAVAISPVTSPFAESPPSVSIAGITMLHGITEFFPELKPADLLTPYGQEKYALVKSLGGSISTSLSLLLDAELLQEGWIHNSFLKKYEALVANGGRQIAGPLLVVHGETDEKLNVAVATAAVEKTLHNFPTAQLDYIRMPNLDHVPTLTGSQRFWMDWIADRFAGKQPNSSGTQLEAKAAMPVTAYQPQINWYLALADRSKFYQTP